MRIEHIDIRNFRAIESATLTLDRATYLVGRNGVGKSTFLNAVGAFFETVRVESADDFHRRNVTEPIEITLRFADLEPAARREFAAYLDGGTLTVTKRYTYPDMRVKVEGYFGTKRGNREFADLRALAGNARLAAYRVVSEQFDLPKERNSATVLQHLEDWERRNPESLEPVRDEGKFFGYRNVASGRLDKYIDFVMIPALRDASRDSGGSKDSALRQLVSAVVRRRTNLDARLRDLRERTVTDINALVELPEYGLADLQDRVNAHFGGYSSGSTIELGWEKIQDIAIPEPMPAARVGDARFTGDVSLQGHGVQRAYLMAVLHALAETERDATGSDAAPAPGLLLAIEEPELYQHPAQARAIARTLDQLADEGGRTVQVLACTHSPYFVSAHRFAAVRRIRRSSAADGANVLVTRAAMSDVAQILQRSGLTKQSSRPDDVAARLTGQLGADFSEAFFSEVAILVEGQEDRAVLESLLNSDTRWSDDRLGSVSVVEAGGKGNLPRLIAVLRALAVPTFLVFDLDRKNKAETANCLTILRVHGVKDPTTATLTHGAGRDYAVMAPNMTHALKAVLGSANWDQRMNAAAKYLKMQREDKNPAQLAYVVQTAVADRVDLGRLGELATAIVDFVDASVG